MSTKELAFNIVDLMNEEQLQCFVTLFQGVVSDVPNEETISAMQEAEETLKDPNAQKFTSVDDLFEELRA